MSGLLFVFLVIMSLQRTATSAVDSMMGVCTCCWATYVVACLLALVSLLVGFGFGLIRLALFRVERLPSLTEDLANLTYSARAMSAHSPETLDRVVSRTKADSGVLLPHVVTLLVGEEHVGRQTTLWCIGVWQRLVSDGLKRRSLGGDEPFFFLPPSVAALALVLRVAFSLGIVSDLARVRVSSRIH